MGRGLIREGGELFKIQSYNMFIEVKCYVALITTMNSCVIK